MRLKPFNDEAGDWRGLGLSSQIPRYAAIGELLHTFGRRSVLDVGCGEALLQNWLPKNSNYTGIEPSAVAVRIACERNPSLNIINTSAESFRSHGEYFDIIVFNEMLYYADDPVGLLRKYAALIQQGGMILCSIYQKPGPISLKSRLLHYFDSRRSISNLHCEKMVRDFMAHEAWQILDDRSILIPEGGGQEWHIWLAMPYHLFFGD